MSYSKMVLEQVKHKEKLELIEQYRSQRPGYQNVLDDAKRLHEQSSTASSMTLPTKDQLDAYAKAFGSGGEIDKRIKQASNFTDPNDATQSTVRGIARKLKGAKDLSADDIFDYERGLGPNIPAVTNPGQSYRDTLEFGNKLRSSIPAKKHKQFDAEYGTRIPGVALKLDDVGTVFNAIDTADSVGSDEAAAQVGKELISKSVRAAGNAAAAQRDNKVQSALTDLGITTDTTPEEQLALSKGAALVGAVETMRTSKNPYIKNYANQVAETNPRYQQEKDNVITTAKQKAPNVINNLLALAPNVDTSTDAVSSYRSNIDDAINKYVPKRKQSAIRDTFNQKIIEPNVNAVQDYIKKNAPNRLTRGSSEYGYRETLRRMGKYQ